MQRLPSLGKSSARPAIKTTKSFSRYDPPESNAAPRTRATTLQSIPVPDYAAITESAAAYKNNGDVFEPQDNETTTDDDEKVIDLESDLAELPDELQSLIDSFLESLGAKVHPTPLSIDQLSELFQNFYEHAQSRIDDHIAILASRYPGQTSRTPSVTSTSSALSKGGGRRTLRSSLKGNATRADYEAQQQMLTPTEVRNRRKIKRQLEHRRAVLDELVEREICQKVYSRLWRHRTTDDEERDEKLRSRAAALALVEVSLKELLSTALSDVTDLQGTPEKEGQSAKDRLAIARSSLEAMTKEHFPLGKLNQLKAAHKSIVEALREMFPASSSADEVLPTLIYSIITSQPDANHIVSNFNYIQRFRNQSKIDGEAAYCLTNLEAAITFLETVDLSSIRSDETPSGPAKSSSRPHTPQHELADPMYHGLPTMPNSPSPEKLRVTKSRSSSSATTRPRASSLLSQQQSKATENATTPTDAVRQAADEALDAMHNALEGSFKFFFGKLKERQDDVAFPNSPKMLTPRTLEDAHKLVSAKTDDDDVLDVDELARPASRDENNNALLRAIGGVRPRDRSMDSGLSADSSRKVSFANSSSPLAPASRSMTTPTPAFSSSPPPAQLTAGSAVDGLRNLGSSLNPLKGWGGVGMMRGFGRAPSGTSTVSNAGSSPVAPAAHDREPEKRETDAAHTDPLRNDVSGIAPGIERFLQCRDGKELNGYDIDLLLRDYQRLAGALKAATESSCHDNECIHLEETTGHIV